MNSKAETQYLTDQFAVSADQLRWRIAQVDRFYWSGVLEVWDRDFTSYTTKTFKWKRARPHLRSRNGNYWLHGWFRWVVVLKLERDLWLYNREQKVKARRNSYAGKTETIYPAGRK